MALRSSSEVRWVRVRNTVGQATKVSSWHAIVPGFGSDGPPPGAACGTGLSGSLQFETDTGVWSKDGVRHGACVGIVSRWIASLDQSPGPMNEEPEHVPLARPKNKFHDGRPAPKVIE